MKNKPAAKNNRFASTEVGVMFRIALFTTIMCSINYNYYNIIKKKCIDTKNGRNIEILIAFENVGSLPVFVYLFYSHTSFLSRLLKNDRRNTEVRC